MSGKEDNFVENSKHIPKVLKMLRNYQRTEKYTTCKPKAVNKAPKMCLIIIHPVNCNKLGCRATWATLPWENGKVSELKRSLTGVIRTHDPHSCALPLPGYLGPECSFRSIQKVRRHKENLTT